MRPAVWVAGFLVLVLAVGAYGSQELLQLQTDDKQWVMPGKDYSQTRYSTLSQITPKNVKNLRPAWTFSTGTLRGHEGAPLVVGDTMYVHTSFPNNVYALDLKGPDVGKIKWAYLPKQDPSVQAVACCDNVNRGLSFVAGKVFLSQLDGNLVMRGEELPETAQRNNARRTLVVDWLASVETQGVMLPTPALLAVEHVDVSGRIPPEQHAVGEVLRANGGALLALVGAAERAADDAVRPPEQAESTLKRARADTVGWPHAHDSVGTGGHG